MEFGLLGPVSARSNGSALHVRRATAAGAPRAPAPGREPGRRASAADRRPLGRRAAGHGGERPAGRGARAATRARPRQNRHAGERLRAPRRAGRARPPPLRRARATSAQRAAGGRRRVARGGARTVARAAARGCRGGAVRSGRRRATRGAAHRGRRAPRRGAARARSRAGTRREPRGADRPPPVPRAPSRPAHARSLPRRAPGGRTRGIRRDAAGARRRARHRPQPRAAGARACDPPPGSFAGGVSAAPDRRRGRCAPAGACDAARRSPPRAGGHHCAPARR